MNPKILLIGTQGQVGRELNLLLPSLGDLVGLDRRQLDLTDVSALRQTVRDFRPDVIVNAAAYTAVDRAETEENLAAAVNAIAPGVMAEEARNTGAMLVHYSTDYVFDGNRRTPYQEDDRPNPLGVYGRTKLAGERAIQQSGARHLIFRTAWVYATEGKNFLLTILRLATVREQLRVVNDQIGAPTCSHHIAAGTVRALASFLAPESGDAHAPQGIYHMTAGGETSWHGFAKAILDHASRINAPPDWFLAATGGKPIVAREVLPITTAEYPTPARRPAFAVLSNLRLLRVFGVQLPDWETQLAGIFSDAEAQASPGNEG